MPTRNDSRNDKGPHMRQQTVNHTPRYLRDRSSLRTRRDSRGRRLLRRDYLSGPCEWILRTYKEKRNDYELVSTDCDDSAVLYTERHIVVAYTWRTMTDLLVIITLLRAPPPARLAALGRGLLAAAPARLATALRRLPLGGGLPARCATSLRCHGELLCTSSMWETPSSTDNPNPRTCTITQSMQHHATCHLKS